MSNIKVGGSGGVRIGGNSPPSHKGYNCPVPLTEKEDGVAPPRDYKASAIKGKSDTGTFGGSYSRGQQGMGG